MKTKRAALLLAILLVFSAAACTSPSESPAPTPADPNASPAEKEWVPPSNVATIGPIPDGALDFSDGSLSYAAVNMMPGGADPSELSIVDYNGGKALKIEVMEGGTPFVGFDVSSMFGDKVADIRTIEMRILTERPSGNFAAASGKLTTMTGTALTETEYLWATALEKNNPRTVTAELEELFVANATNIFSVSKNSDNGPANDQANLIIDYILFLDASGNPMTPDTSVSFVAPAGFGTADISLLFTVTDEVSWGFMDNGATGKSTGWGQAGQTDMPNVDVSLIKPGCIITVGFLSEKAPELIFQSWESDRPENCNGWGKIAPYTTNLFGNLVQFRYEDMVEGFGSDEFDKWLNRICVGDWGVDLTVKSVTIGQRTEDELSSPRYLVGHDEFKDLIALDVQGSDASCGAWGQAIRIDTKNATDDNPPDFKPGWLVEGSYVIANFVYTTINVDYADCPGLILQRSATGDMPEIWSQMNGVDDALYLNDELGIVAWSFDAIDAMWKSNGGGSYEDELSTFWLGGRFNDIKFLKAYLYTPNPWPEGDE